MQIGYVNVFVADLARAMEFYGTTLGLKLRHGDAARGVTFAMPPTRQPWGGFMALLEDSEGNLLYLDETSAAHPQ